MDGWVGGRVRVHASDKELTTDPPTPHAQHERPNSLDPVIQALDGELQNAKTEADAARLKQQIKEREDSLLPLYLQVRYMDMCIYVMARPPMGCLCRPALPLQTRTPTEPPLKPLNLTEPQTGGARVRGPARPRWPHEGQGRHPRRGDVEALPLLLLLARAPPHRRGRPRYVFGFFLRL